MGMIKALAELSWSVLAGVWGGRKGRALIIALAVLLAGWLVHAFGYPAFFRWYTGDHIEEPSYPNQRAVTDGEFEELARQILEEFMLPEAVKAAADVTDETTREDRVRLLLLTRSFVGRACFRHIDIFRKNAVREYKGSDTCLQCHETMRVETADGYQTVDTMHDVLDTVHFRLFMTTSGFSTVGYNGEKVNSGWYKIPVGKIDRACGIPGSFTWTGWADLIEASPEHGGKQYMSVGCGQCHIGGMYGPPSEAMMPSLKTPKQARDAIDCLICHSITYDMNEKYVIEDQGGKRWNQDRSMKAAMGVTKPRAHMCLHCHQHNLGGDAYVLNESSTQLGYKHKRLMHDASKRATPFGPDWDVHAAAGMDCLDCHQSRGHKIARGQKGVDLVANDLPEVEVSCERCHTAAPHVENKTTRAILNGHVARVACETCHITSLHPSNLIMVDWINTKYNAKEGIWTPSAVKVAGDIKEAVEYLWFNGNGTFLANALGANPNHSDDYNPLMNQLARYDKDPALVLDGSAAGNVFTSQLSPEMLRRRKQMIEQNLRPAMNDGVSRIYPFKLFNAYMFEDMANQGPFGAMILPFDYKIYYETGNARAAMEKAVRHPIVRRMYQPLFKYYMMDRFMDYFGVDGWHMKYPLDPQNQKNIEPHWMRQMGTLMINHAIRKQGFDCADCHTQNGLLDFRKLGYSEARAAELENPPDLKAYNLEPKKKAGDDKPPAKQAGAGMGKEPPIRAMNPYVEIPETSE